MFIYMIGQDTIIAHEGPRCVAYPNHGLPDVATILDRLPAWDESTIIYDTIGLTHYELRDQIRAAGWSTAETDGAWHVCRQGSRQVTIGVRSWGRDDPMIGEHLLSSHAAGALWEYATLTGTHYAITPGVSATINLRTWLRNTRPKWVLRNPATVEYWRPPCQITDIRWSRKHTGPTHRWDMRSAYLAAVGATDLPSGQLTPEYISHNDAAGYYRIRISTPVPQPLLGRKDRQGTLWATHTALRHLEDQGVPFETVEAWSTTKHGRFLRGWAEHWRDATTTAIRPATKTALKRGYSEMIGLWNVPRGTIYRPDWRHMIIDAVRVSLIRRIARVNELCKISPVRVDVDSVWYSAAEIETAGWTSDKIGEALGVGDQIGRMRYEGIEE